MSALRLQTNQVDWLQNGPLGETVGFLSHLIGSLTQICQSLSLPMRVYYCPLLLAKGHEEGVYRHYRLYRQEE